MQPQVRIFQNERPGFTLEDAIAYVRSHGPNDFGCIWLRHENGTQLAVLVRGLQTYPHFFPVGDHPGWQVVTEAGDWNTYLDFQADNYEITPTPLALVLPVDRTIEILRHHWHRGERADGEQWIEL